MKKLHAKIQGVPYWYYPDDGIEGNFEPKYFWCDFALSIIMDIKCFICDIMGYEKEFKIKIRIDDNDTNT